MLYIKWFLQLCAKRSRNKYGKNISEVTEVTIGNSENVERVKEKDKTVLVFNKFLNKS